MFGTAPSRLPALLVFLADNDGEMRRMIAMLLRRDGHLVLEAEDGAGLLLDLGHAFWADEPDRRGSLIISDHHLPARDGLSILRGIRRHAWCPPFILMTALGDQRVHEEARRLGAHAVFHKPFELEALRFAVDRIARIRRNGNPLPC
jgi:two-component system, response regulator, stage 0 sporulation protein F